MNTRLTLAALAVLTATGPVQATDLNPMRVDLNTLNLGRWLCKRCTLDGTEARVSLSLGTLESDDNHAQNRLGATDGSVAAVNAKLGSDRLTLEGVQLGMESGYGNAHYTGTSLDSRLGYSQLRHVASRAENSVGLKGNTLVPLAIPQPADLETTRKEGEVRLGYRAETDTLNYQGHMGFRQSDRQGQKATSVTLIKQPVNLVHPFDHRSQRWDAGLAMASGTWSTSLNYSGRDFSNRQAELDYLDFGSALALEPDSEMHRLDLQGRYQGQELFLFGRVNRSWLYQQETPYVDLIGAPLGVTHLDGQVDQVNASLKAGARLGPQVRLKGYWEYHDRDNRTPVFRFETASADPLTGRTRENAPLDLNRQRYGVQLNWRTSPAMKVQLGGDISSIERNHSVREQTDEGRLWLKASGHLGWSDAKLTVSHTDRDGSSYLAEQAGQDNPLLRKYHLADRKRSELQLDLTLAPIEPLSLQLNGRFSLDDYDRTQVGLSEAKDKSVDLSAQYRLSRQLVLSLSGGLQIIDSTQLGQSSSDWRYQVEEEFRYLGLGVKARELPLDALTLSLDYRYNESDSRTSAEVDGYLPASYGDYLQWSHSVTGAAQYRYSTQLSFKLEYRYERYYDTDYQDVEPEQIPGLTTLGNLSHDYTAHLVMASAIYQF